MKVVRAWFGRTIIRSEYKVRVLRTVDDDIRVLQLHYELAQQIFDGMADADIVASIPKLQSLDANEATKRSALHFGMTDQQRTYCMHSVSELRGAISLLVDTSRAIAQRRLASGALQLSSQEIRVTFDESKKNITGLLESVCHVPGSSGSQH